MEKGEKERGKSIPLSCIRSTKGQVTIFIILGIIVLVGIVTYFAINNPLQPTLSKNLKLGDDAYVSCMQQRAEQGIKVLGQQGGYIYTNELPFYHGSAFMPSSSQLDFYGNPVPYWFYASGNNILREQKPSLDKMEGELARYVEEGLADCDFTDLNEQGIYVDVYNGSVDVKINGLSVDVLLNNPIYISFENQSSYVENHEFSIKSKLGKFYELASKTYAVQRKDSFLESYGLDVMRLYAPVTGVELSCAPKAFNEVQVKNDLINGLESNLAYLKLKGNYYDLFSADNNYFVIDIGENVDEQVNFIYSRNWPTRIDMEGEKVVQPLGNQQGVGLLGLCFVPYHFVYDINFPVLIQFYDDKEIFQFGMVGIIDNSRALENSVSLNDVQASQICQNANQNISISTYDFNLDPVEANLRFSCLGDSCDLGSTKTLGAKSSLISQVPQCVNGIIYAESTGYASTNYIISTNRETSADILMKRIYDVPVDLGNVERASVVFSSEDYSSVLDYPASNIAQIVEGDYNITVYVYKNTTINFPEVKDRKCLSVPSNSIGGLVGETEESCFDIDIPAQIVDTALVGGGRAQYYFTEDQFENSNKLNINVPLFDAPQSLDDLQDNYIRWEISSLEVQFV